MSLISGERRYYYGQNIYRGLDAGVDVRGLRFSI